MKHWRNRTSTLSTALWYHFPASEITQQATVQAVIQKPVSRQEDFRSGWVDPLVQQNCKYTMNPQKMMICQILNQAATLHGIIVSNTEMVTYLLISLPTGLEDTTLVRILICLICYHR